MSEQGVYEKLLCILSNVAIDENIDELEWTGAIKDQLDLDSMDFLDVIMEIKKQFGVKIEPQDYAQLKSFNDLAAHISRQLYREAS